MSRVILLVAFWPPSYSGYLEVKLHLLCPVYKLPYLTHDLHQTHGGVVYYQECADTKSKKHLPS